jgi:hypothetical protein
MKGTKMGNPIFNASGCKDKTAFEATKNVSKEEHELDHKVHKLINLVKELFEFAGFEMIGRIQIKHKKSGREFK